MRLILETVLIIEETFFLSDSMSTVSLSNELKVNCTKISKKYLINKKSSKTVILKNFFNFKCIHGY